MRSDVVLHLTPGMESACMLMHACPVFLVFSFLVVRFKTLEEAADESFFSPSNSNIP